MFCDNTHIQGLSAKMFSKPNSVGLVFLRLFVDCQVEPMHYQCNICPNPGKLSLISSYYPFKWYPVCGCFQKEPAEKSKSKHRRQRHMAVLLVFVSPGHGSKNTLVPLWWRWVWPTGCWVSITSESEVSRCTLIAPESLHWEKSSSR